MMAPVGAWNKVLMIKIGPAGLGGQAITNIRYLKGIGIECAELAFTRGVYLSNEKSKELGKEAEKLKFSLSIHAPYYINLTSEDPQKIKDSKKRIMESCERGHHATAKYIVFHPAYYGKLNKEKCYELVKKEIEELQELIKKNNFNVILCPETTGKISQFGDIDELTKLSKQTGCGICVDFAHIYARNQGKINYDDVSKKIKDIKNLTAHFSGINYGLKGEKNHIPTPKEEAEKLLNSLNKNKINIRIINESPQPVRDTLMMQGILGKL